MSGILYRLTAAGYERRQLMAGGIPRCTRNVSVSPHCVNAKCADSNRVIDVDPLEVWW
jgi:hypothetical protein